LVVANQQYQHWVKLDTPRSDAQAVAAVLKQRFGFEVTLLQDATRQQLLAALSRLRQQVGPQDQVVVYYAGHGQMDSVTARGYWIPVDGDEKDLAQWVSVIDVTDQLSAMTARHVLVIADSCYSGTLTRSLVPAVDQALTLEQRMGPLKQLSKQRARVAMTSGGLEPVVDGGSVEHSLFARSLLDVLARVSSPVAAQELHNAVAARFAHLARRLKIQQQPQYAPIGFAGHEAGDFVFSPI
ncbi:MAG: caspase family protein, partial [Cytophagales bacterium]|nr:caspase family protein [Rhizobacter sp.]